jgi:hypothetical protein
MEAVLTGAVGLAVEADVAAAGAWGAPKKSCNSPCAEAGEVAVTAAMQTSESERRTPPVDDMWPSS